MLLGAEQFLYNVRTYRLCWLMGRFGAGKTALAYRIYAELANIDSRYKLITNNLSVWRDDISKIQLDNDNKARLYVILDEGGEDFRNTRQVENLIKACNKMDIIYMIPSYIPPARNAQSLTCQPIYSFRGIGLPITMYRWQIRLGGWLDVGQFAWLNMAEIYGVYSRNDPGDDPAEIVSHLSRLYEEFRGRYGRKSKTIKTVISLPDMETTRESVSVELLQDAISELAEQVDRQESAVYQRRTKFFRGALRR